MARNRVSAAHATQPTDAPPTDAPSIPGGGEGIPPEAVASPMIGAVSGVSAVRVSDRPDVAVPQYRVKVGGYVMLGGVRVPMRVGKVLDERQYDLSALAQQGIVLDLIDGDPGAVQKRSSSETIKNAADERAAKEKAEEQHRPPPAVVASNQQAERQRHVDAATK